MYSIIYWINDNKCYPLLNKNRTLKLFETIKEADEMAENVESHTYKIDKSKVKFLEEPTIDDEVYARVVSIEGVEGDDEDRAEKFADDKNSGSL